MRNVKHTILDIPDLDLGDSNSIADLPVLAPDSDLQCLGLPSFQPPESPLPSNSSQRGLGSSNQTFVISVVVW